MNKGKAGHLTREENSKVHGEKYRHLNRAWTCLWVWGEVGGGGSVCDGGRDRGRVKRSDEWTKGAGASGCGGTPMHGPFTSAHLAQHHARHNKSANHDQALDNSPCLGQRRPQGGINKILRIQPRSSGEWRCERCGLWVPAGCRHACTSASRRDAQGMPPRRASEAHPRLPRRPHLDLLHILLHRLQRGTTAGQV